MLNKLKFIIPDQILLTIYNSLILPHLNYCILPWAYDSQLLYKLPKKALRIINKTPYLAHTDPMFLKYNVPKVTDILEQKHLKFLFKSVHRSLPNYFYHFVSATCFDVHTHNTNSEKNVYVSVLLIPLIFLLVSFLIKYIHIHLLVFVNMLKYIILPSMTLPALFKIVLYVKKSIPNFLTFTHLFHT